MNAKQRKNRLSWFAGQVLLVTVSLYPAISSGTSLQTQGEYFGTVALTAAKNAELQRNYVKAMAYYRKAIAIKESEDLATIGLSKILVKQSLLDEATELVSNYLRDVNPFHPDVRLAMVDIWINKNDFAKALDGIAIVEKMRPGYPPISLRRGQIFFGQGSYDASQKQLSICLRTKDCGSEARLMRAQCNLKLEHYTPAVDDLKMLVSEIPADAERHTLLAEGLIGMGQIYEAEKSLRYALKLKPSYSYASLVLAELLMLKHRDEDAIALLKFASDIDPKNKILANRLVKAFLAVHQIQEAEEELNKIYRSDPTDDAAAGSLVSLYFQDQRKDLAAQFLRGYLELNPEKNWAIADYAKLLL